MRNDIFIYDFERVDDLQRNGYHIIQDPKRFCFGIDAVLLSCFANVKKGEHVLDLGTGTGIIPILLEAKTKGEHFIGLEIQPESAEMARRSVKLNNLEEKIEIHEGDIKDCINLYKPSSFDVITSNPPYMNDGGGLKNDYSPKTIARHEVLCNLDDVIRSAARLLKTSGRFYMVHRPRRLVDIICKLREYKLEPKTMRFVHPFVDKEPNIVLIEAIRNGRPMLKNLPPIIIYEKDGTYTQDYIDMYYGETEDTK